MERLLRYVIHNRKKIIKKVALFTVAVIAFALAHKAGTAERGYEAIGGEMFVPVLIIFAPKILEILKTPFVKE